jgi:hypothetical protein
VSFDIRGNEYNGKYYVNLACWKIQAAGAAPESPRRSAPSAAANSAEPSIADLRDDGDFDDDVPF